MDWHRLFGLILIDQFTGTPFVVELEKDVSIQQQYLDVLIVRKVAGLVPFRLPDGFDDLTEHNLVSFKSYQEAFDDWAMKELLAHQVLYRKLASPSRNALIAEDQFRCYAVCARFPTSLRSYMTERQVGVWDCQWGSDVVRVIVLRDLPREEHNAPLHLFSAAREQVEYGQEHFRERSGNISNLVHKLLRRYRQEGVPMPYTMEDYRRDSKEEALKYLQELPPEERLKGLPPEELLKHVPPEKRLEGLSPEKRLEGLSPEKRLEGLSPEDIENYLKKLKGRKATS